MAKMTATENAQRVIDMALQMYGGRGVKVGTRVESLYRDIRSLRIYEGATEVQQLIIGKGGAAIMTSSITAPSQRPDRPLRARPPAAARAVAPAACDLPELQTSRSRSTWCDALFDAGHCKTAMPTGRCCARTGRTLSYAEARSA